MRYATLPSIKVQIYTLVWACALPAIVGFTLLANTFIERERAQIKQDTLITARALIQAVDRDLNTGISMALALSNSPIRSVPMVRCCPIPAARNASAKSSIPPNR
jgi:two-component system sensor histidine kinase/response regulator